MIQFLFLLFLIFPATVSAEEVLYEGFPPIVESQAYQKLSTRKINENTKLHYLIDRYENSKIQIRYDDRLYDAKLASFFARWFLGKSYAGQTVEEWIKKYCDRSIFTGDPIWVKLPNGKFKRSKKVLEAEVKALDALLEQSAKTQG